MSDSYTDPEYGSYQPPGMEWITYLAWGYANNGRCYYTEGQWVPEGTGAGLAAEWTILEQLQHEWQVNGNGDPPACNSINQILNSGPPDMPSEQVLWDHVSALLPRPNPLRVQPGRAITGIAAFLETNRDLTWQAPPAGLEAMPGGMVSVTAEAHFTVDWGDQFSDEDDTKYTTEGIGPPMREGEFPNQPEDLQNPDAVWHNYTHKPESGETTITVTDHWTVTFEDEWDRTTTVEGTLHDTLTIAIISMEARIVG